jgi:hypothetical protein
VGTELDDGLLTAGEIAQLKLNADWVVLSACNTAATDGTPDAAGLSGLARAFLYAGSRALLVSHWSVSSSAALKLTVGMFDEAAKNPTIGFRLLIFEELRPRSSKKRECHGSRRDPFAKPGDTQRC